ATAASQPKPKRVVDEAIDFGNLGINNGSASTRPDQRPKPKPVVDQAIDFAGIGNRQDGTERTTNHISDEEFLAEFKTRTTNEDEGENFQNPYWQEDALVARLNGVSTETGYTIAEIQKAEKFIGHLKARRMPYDQAIGLMVAMSFVIRSATDESTTVEDNTSTTDPAAEEEEIEV
ncbi:MAG: hypothetical protein AAB288_08360, partial [Acidobacteriota bacterium]